MGARLITIYDHIPRIVAGMEPAIEVAIDKWAAGTIQQAMSGTPQVTGALRASGYRVSKVFNNYSAAVAAMTARNPKAQAADPPIPQKNAVIFGFAADYAPHVENGHHTRGGSFVPAHPFMHPAIESRREELPRMIKAKIEELAVL